MNTDDFANANAREMPQTPVPRLIAALDAAPVLGCGGCDECGNVDAPQDLADFTTAARSESERLAPTPEDGERFHVWNTRDMRDHAEEMAEWARDHLAAQEETEEDLDAALLTFLTAENLAVIPGISRERAEEYAREEMRHGVERVREALRAALAAARAVRQEKP